jgi:hypothetical protein
VFASGGAALGENGLGQCSGGASRRNADQGDVARRGEQVTSIDMGAERVERPAVPRRPLSPNKRRDPDRVQPPWSPRGALHMQRLVGNRAVRRIAQGDPAALATVGVQRQPTVGSTTTRAASAQERLRRRWGVRIIRAGTLSEQAVELIRYGTVPRSTPQADAERMLQAAGWTSWSPAADHGLWDDLVKAFDDVGGVFGGTPRIERILFFKTGWRHDPAGSGGPVLAPHDDEGAYVSGTTMGVNELGARDQMSLPTARTRSREGRNGINVSLADRLQVMTHELGHGLVQAFLADDPVAKAQRFALDVGWYQQRELYDIQGPGVRDALGRGDSPDPTQQITGTDWFMPKWKEQPPSRYAVTHGPAEDMAETLMMFVRARSTLGDRSPARLAWANGVMAALQARPQALQAPISDSAAELGGHRGSP